MRPVVPIYTSATERVGEWGIRVEAGKSFVWCAEVEETAAMEGLMLFNAEARSPAIDTWFSRIESELNASMAGLVSLEEARAEWRTFAMVPVREGGYRETDIGRESSGGGPRSDL